MRLPVPSAPVAATLLVLLAACENPAGDPGPTGDVGPEGPAGLDGTDGADGTDGVDGTDGTDGTDGEPGRDGTDGTDGEDGRSAYWTGPGLRVAVLAARIEGRVASVDVSLSDGEDVPLDREGRLTHGRVDVRFTLARLDLTDGATGPWVALVTRVAAAGDVQAVQPTYDEGGAWSPLSDGVYRYVFATPIEVPDPARTHRVVVTAARSFDGTTHRAGATLDFVPSGGAPAARELATEAACDSCHRQLDAHDGMHRGLAACVACHVPGTVDPDTGNALDLAALAHRIHRGPELPSVLEGTPYTLVGLDGEVHDYSGTRYPRPVARCETCHDGPDGDRSLTNPGRAACGACHDRTSFAEPPPAGFSSHGGGVQADDANCSVCHPSAGGLAGIADAHAARPAPDAAPSIQILSVVNSAPGQTPTVRFSVAVGGAPRNLQVAPLSTLRMTFAGPTTDYSAYWQSTVQGSGATGTLTAVDAPNGVFDYTAPASAAIPATAAGTYAAALEGNIVATDGARAIAVGPVAFFAVTDAVAVPRRTVVSDDRCDACHGGLIGHNARRGVASCLLCHHAGNSNDERAAHVEGQTAVAEPVHFKHMIHKLHAGAMLGQPYVLYGNPTPTTTNPYGTPLRFDDLVFTADLRWCEACHEPGTYSLPLAPGAPPTRRDVVGCLEDPWADTDSFCQTINRTATPSYLAPETSACTSCHDAPATLVHAQVNQNESGEACAACHGPGREHDVAVVHRPAP